MDTLTKDALIYFALMLDMDDLLSLCNTSTRYNYLLCGNDNFWKMKLLNEYGIFSHEVPEGRTHKNYYKELLDYVPGTDTDAGHLKSEYQGDKRLSTPYYLPLEFFKLELNRLEKEGNQIINMDLKTREAMKEYHRAASRYTTKIKRLYKNFRSTMLKNRKYYAFKPGSYIVGSDIHTKIFDLAISFRDLTKMNYRFKFLMEGSQQELDNHKERFFLGLRSLEEDYAGIVPLPQL